MTYAYRHGLRAALRHVPLVLMVFGFSAVAALIMGALSWAWLATALDNSLATRTLLTDLDMNVFVDLFAHHRESLHMLLVLAACLAVVFLTAGTWLNAVIVSAVRTVPNSAELARRRSAAFAAFVRLLLLALVADLVGIAAGWALGHALVRWTAESASEMPYYGSVAAGLALAAAVVFIVTTAHDHARVYWMASGAGAGHAFVWGVRFVGRTPRSWLLMAVVLLTGALWWALYQGVGLTLQPTSVLGLVLSIIWAECFMLGRAYLRVARFAAAAQLQSALHGPR